LSRFLPDDLLTFGTFWSDLIRFPGQTVAVGKPRLDEARAGALASEKRTVLVVSSVSERDAVSDLTLAIRAGLDSSWSVELRPHPSERATVANRYSRLFAHPGISFDMTPDLYDSLGKAAAVVGTASTVLYEALALGVAVFVRESILSDLYLDADLFPFRLRGEADLESMLIAIRSGRLEHQAPAMHTVFAPNAIDNFARYAAAHTSAPQNE